MANVDLALEYAQRGWHVFPIHYVTASGQCSCRMAKCERVGKHPTIKNGVLAASTDIDQINSWWSGRPYANIGLATGHGGLVVMDVDTDESKGKKGAQSFAELTKSFGELPATLTGQTGSGGAHYYFLSKADIRNSASKVGKDIDVRGVGGYVILPPSNHASGGRYAWVNPGCEIATLPDWLEARMLGSAPSSTKKSKVDATADSPDEGMEKDAKAKKEVSFSREQVVKLLDWIPADCDRDTWWKIGAGLKKELGEDAGFKAFNEWSAKAGDKYSEREVIRQWPSFVDAGISGATIYHYAKENGFRGFDKEAADAPEIKNNWVFVLAIKRFVDTATMQELDAEQFSCKFAPSFQKGKAADHVLRNEEFKRVDAPTYWPAKEMFIEEGGFSKLNYWRPVGISPKKGDVSLFLQHIEYLFPDKVEAGVLLDFMAYQVQRPGDKVHWAPVVVGVQGTGKSYLAHVMKAVLGDHNVRTLHNETLHEGFTGWQKNTQLIVVEELMARQRLELMNKLKPMITEPWCSIREMYRPPYEQVNRFNFLFLTNHEDALIIDNTDRRYCILSSTVVPIEDGLYYDRLFSAIPVSGPALLHWFLGRDLSKFRPKGHAPMTEGKKKMIMESMMPLDQFIFEHVAAGVWPFAGDLVVPSALVETLEGFNLRCNPKEIGKALSRLGAVAIGKARVGADMVRMWAVRSAPIYEAMTASQLRQAWTDQLQSSGSLGGGDAGAAPSDDDLIRAHRPQNPVMERKPM